MMYQDYNERENPLEDLIVGRIVHFRENGNDIAGIVTKVHEKVTGSVNLMVFPPYGAPELKTSIPYERYGSEHSWHWPRLV